MKRLNLLNYGIPYKRIIDLIPNIPNTPDLSLSYDEELFSEIKVNEYHNKSVYDDLNFTKKIFN